LLGAADRGDGVLQAALHVLLQGLGSYEKNVALPTQSESWTISARVAGEAHAFFTRAITTARLLDGQLN
jgi:hypothetical protein